MSWKAQMQHITMLIMWYSEIMNTIKSACSAYRFDIVVLEFFGYLMKSHPTSYSHIVYCNLKKYLKTKENL